MKQPGQNLLARSAVGHVTVCTGSALPRSERSYCVYFTYRKLDSSLYIFIQTVTMSSDHQSDIAGFMCDYRDPGLFSGADRTRLFEEVQVA